MSYGMNENQNFFMEGSKTTSRVTNVPGGRSSINLSWDSPTMGVKSNEINETGDERTNNNSSRNHQKIVVPDEIMQVVGTAAAMSRERNNSSMLGNTQNDKMRKASTESTGSASVSSSVSSNQFASGSRMNSGNVLTDRPSSRVTQPPGGRSSICFY